MPQAIILIPARMASTRLPGKPLADIAGLPMIVHVLRRAEAARVGAAVVATDSEAVAAAVEKAGGRAVMTRADHVSGSDRIYEALEALDPEHRFDIVVNVQGDLPTIEPADIRAALGPLADPAVDIATLAAAIIDPAELTNPNVVKAIGQPVAPGRLRATTFHPRQCPRGQARTITISGFMPIGAPRSNASSRCRPRPMSGARSSSSCARSSRHAHRRGGGRKPCRSASIRRRNWPRRARCSPVDAPKAAARNGRPATGSGMCHEQQENHLPGRAGGEFASRLPRSLSGPRAGALPDLRGCFTALAAGEADLGMIPIENSVAGRVADIHHLMPHCGLHIIAEWFLPIRNQLMAPKGARLETIKTVQSHVMALGQCRNIIRELKLKPIVAADTAGSAREVAESRRRHAARRSPRDWRRKSTASIS